MNIITIVPENEEAFEPLLMGTLDQNRMALGAVEDGYAVGVMVFHTEKTTVCIDHIWVVDGYQKRGAGHAMLERLCEKATEAGIYAIEIQTDDDGRDSLIPFLLNEGFSMAESGMTFSVPVEELVTSASFNKMVKGVDKTIARPLSEFSGAKLNVLNNYLINDLGIPDGFEKGSYDADLSIAIYNMDSKTFEGCLFMDKQEEDMVLLYLANFGEDRSVLPKLFAKLKDIVLKKHLGDCILHYEILDENKNSLLDLILPNGEDIVESGKMYTGIKLL